VFIITIGKKSFLNFPIQQGLVNYQVPCIYEDKTGHIWFGTLSGAGRYDGKTFRNFKINEGLPAHEDNVVYAFMEDKTGKFWFGTKGKAFIYNGKTFNALTHKGKL
jgi:ligand-binding sensor domain-containing protein